MEIRGEGLSFDEVLLVPRYSNKTSRDMVDITTADYDMPIMMSPMDTITSPEMIDLFNDNNLLSCIHRYFNSPEEQYEFVSKCKEIDKIWFSVGSIKKYEEWILELYSKGVRRFLIDMAHGDCSLCVDTIKMIKSLNRTNLVMAGNVVTKAGFERLQTAGANYIRVGVGSGCFTPNMEVSTENGLIKISEIKNGDKIYTHTGELKEVINTIQSDRNEEILEINGIECTKNHEFYVIHEKFKNIINDENIHEFATWIKAEKLSDKYYLVELE